jgi:hypothetical protein
MRALREVVGWVCVGRREKEKGGRVLWAGRDGRGGVRMLVLDGEGG